MRAQTCIECQEAITNPICPDCIEKEVVAWLNDRYPTLIPSVQGRGHDTMMNWVTECIVCGNKMSLCGHCYTKEILSIIKLNNKRQLEEDFVSAFNFEIG